MEENIEITDKEDLALDLLEPGESRLDEINNASLLSDSQTMNVSVEILKCKNAVLQEFSRTEPNVELEWERFTTKVKRKNRRLNFSQVIFSGVAASVLLFVIFSLFNTKTNNNDSLVVFKASNAAKQVILETSAGNKIALDENAISVLQANAGANMLMTGKSTLTYKQVENLPEIHKLSTPRGMDFMIELADGTRVWLNAESTLEYPSIFIGDERIVKLKGEAYFEVSKDKEHPFIVETDNIKTKVLGTEFNIRSYVKSDSHVTLIEGSVEVANRINGSSMKIKPGQDVELKDNGEFAIKEVDLDSYIYWKNGFFYFDNVSLSDIMQNLGRWYNVNVVFHNKEAMQYKIHFLCDRKGEINHAISLLKRMNKVEITMDGNTIHIY